MYAIRSYYAHQGAPGGKGDPPFRDPQPDQEQPRITSYNVCYTKLLRDLVKLERGYLMARGGIADEVFGAQDAPSEDAAEAS